MTQSGKERSVEVKSALEGVKTYDSFEDMIEDVKDTMGHLHNRVVEKEKRGRMNVRNRDR